jgi:(p)ppGpp synthase/HD superfamily hydrolase
MNNQVYKALLMAMEAHKGQVDKAGIDYINHPVWIALQLEEDDEKIIALLHDVLEDSDFIEDDLVAAGFSPVIIHTIKILTRKKNEDYFKYIDRISKDYWAIKIKLLDLKHNADLNRLKEVTEKDYQRMEKYQKAIEILQGVLDRIED